jgi:hypothetical protein
VASALIGSSVFFSSLQEANRNAAAQMVKVIRFIKKIFGRKRYNFFIIHNYFFDEILNFVDKIARQ